jgi:hypothetical protein
MEPHLQVAMKGLLELKPAKRWSLDKLSKETLQQGDSSSSTGDTAWIKPHVENVANSKYIHRFRTGKPPLTAFAAYISERHTHIIGKTLADLGLRTKFGAVVLLIDAGGGECEKVPSPSTKIEARVWMYFGVYKGSDSEIDSAIEGLTALIFGAKGAAGEGQTRVVDGPCELLAFTLEFDVFTFPAHIPKNSSLGPKGLDMRSIFRVNLAGILKTGEEEPVWFPGPDATVAPGDLGLVVRRPRRDGSTESTIVDDDLHNMMVEALFTKRSASNLDRSA